LQNSDSTVVPVANGSFDFQRSVDDPSCLLSMTLGQHIKNTLSCDVEVVHLLFLKRSSLDSASTECNILVNMSLICLL